MQREHNFSRDKRTNVYYNLKLRNTRKVEENQKVPEQQI